MQCRIKAASGGRRFGAALLLPIHPWRLLVIDLAWISGCLQALIPSGIRLTHQTICDSFFVWAGRNRLAPCHSAGCGTAP